MPPGAQQSRQRGWRSAQRASSVGGRDDARHAAAADRGDLEARLEPGRLGMRRQPDLGGAADAPPLLAADHLERVTGNKSLGRTLSELVDLKDAGHYGISNVKFCYKT